MKDMLNAAMPFLLGVVLIGGGASFWLYEQRLRRICTVQTEGVVVDAGHSVRYKNGKRKEGYQPTFSYSVDGVEHTKRTSTVHRSRTFSEGQSVTVFYDPAKPQRYYVLEEGRIIALVVVPIILGVIVTGIGVLTRFVFYRG